MDGLLLTLRTPALLVRRDLAGLSRRWPLFVMRGAAALLATLMGTIFLWSYSQRAQATQLGSMGAYLFFATLGIQLLLMLSVGPLRALGAISTERDRGTWGLLVLTRMGAVRTVLGKLASVFVLQLALVLGFVPIQLLAVCYGGVDYWDLLISGTLLVEAALLGASVGLVCGFLFRRALTRLLGMGVLCALVYGAGTLAVAYICYKLGYSPERVIYTYHPTVLLLLVFPQAHGPSLTALWSGIPIQIVLYTVLACVLARRMSRTTEEHLSLTSLWHRLRQRLGIGMWLLGCFGLPALPLLWVALTSGKLSQVLDPNAWSFWLASEAGLVLLAVPLLAAIPLAREREQGTMPMLLVTPVLPFRRYLAALRPAGVFLVAAVLLMALHRLLFVAMVMGERRGMFVDPGAGGLPFTFPVEVALAALLPIGIALVVSSVAPTVFKSLAATAVAVFLIGAGPIIAIPFAYFVVGEGCEQIGWLSPFSVFAPRSEGGPSAPLFAAIGAILILIGAAVFESLQRRYPVRR